MKLSISKTSKIFVPVRANFASGGPELLHQLVYNLRKLGYEAYMFYISNSNAHPIHPSFEHYNNPFVLEIEDKETNIIIVPEMYNTILLLDRLKLIQKVVWWLSIDNFFASRSKAIFSHNIIIFTCSAINKILKTNKIDIPNIVKFLNKKFTIESENRMHEIRLHLVQSNYAADYLLQLGVNEEKISLLSDYLNDDFLSLEFENAKKDNIILYNPSKGASFTMKVIKKAPELNFVPIINYSREETKNLFLKAKVYIDFGHHPGKDRMPREAALAGCCIITGKRGSAANSKDIEINDKYKFADEEKNIGHIVNMTKNCLEDYDSLIDDFKNYRKKILAEKENFLTELKMIILTARQGN